MESRKEQREFVRIETGGEVFFRAIDSVQAEELEAKIVQRDRGADGMAPEWEGYSSFELKVLRTMATIEAKLDAVLDMLEEENRVNGEEALRKGTLVNLSASGVVFRTRNKANLVPDQQLELKLSPAGYLGPPVLTLAQVIHTSPVEAQNRVEVAACFRTIGGYDQERLVSYTFRQMRRAIQSKNKEQDS